ncbi:MAG TPA: hypothetical protein DCZ01_10685 [Elusimicrobia bacterium]|nr:MAG: hypothetical protein A2X37_11795 [Elusimicrobia bacterium GWA2_66_18]HAZ08958.1 hypothetical protein [Elusimicrobiota bacterium]
MRLRLPSRLSWKLLASILPIVILGVSVIVWLQYSMARRELLSAVDKEMQFLAQRTAAGLDDFLDQRRRDLFTLAETPLIADYYRNVDFQLDDEAEAYRKELERYLRNFADRNGVYAQILYLDRRGREVCAIRSRALASRPAHARADYFIKARAAGPGGWWTSSIEALEGEGSVIYFSKPVHDELRQLKGVLVLCYDLAQLRGLLRNVEMGRRGRAYVQASDGRRLEARPREGGDSGLLVASSLLRRRPWAVIVEAPLEEFLGPLRKVKNVALLTSLLGLAVLVAILLLLVRSITRPIAVLVSAARKIGEGDFGHRIQEEGTGELRTLSDSFNEMARRLEQNLERTTQLQSQLIQAEKLSAVGQLISAVAHEISNPLQAISGYVQNALHDGCPPQMQEDLTRVYQNVFRCRKIVDNLLFFVRQSGRERKKVDLNRAVDSALELLEYRLAKTERVLVEKALSSEPPDIIGDFQQVVQVLVNLIGNACDAMREMARAPQGKRLSVRTGSDGRRAFIEISDNGGGVAPEIKEKIFEPFYTTKEAGRGTGLGLSICRQILREHGGDISLESGEGRGSVFRVEIPIAAQKDLDLLEAVQEPASYPAVPGKRILVADDEKDIAELIARLLRADGDDVEIARDGGEALALLERNVYDLVVSDMAMGHATGPDLHARLALQGRLESTRMLFVTGDMLNAKVLDFFDSTSSEYLVKPFDIDDLRQSVRRLLDEKP